MNVTDRKARFASVLAALSSAQIGIALFNTARHKVMEKVSYTLRIPLDGEYVNDVIAEFAEAVGLSGRNVRGQEFWDDNEKRFRFLFDDDTRRTVTFLSHRVDVAMEKPELVGGQRSTHPRDKVLTLTVRSEAARDALTSFFESAWVKAKRDKKPAGLFSRANWDEWGRVASYRPRKLAHVVLKEGQKERIVRDLQSFLDSESRYEEVGAPFHRGYIFHGPPGTGKTSLALALSHEFNLNIYQLTLSSVKSDELLLKDIEAIPPRSILLMEDVDIFHGMRERDDEAFVTMSGILNALDGARTPHGLITILTTNAIDELDPAILRPGRIDMVEELGTVGPREVERLFELSFGTSHVMMAPDGEYVPAAVKEAMKRHMWDPELAAQEIVELAWGKVGV